MTRPCLTLTGSASSKGTRILSRNDVLGYVIFTGFCLHLHLYGVGGHKSSQERAFFSNRSRAGGVLFQA
jgi:hypothetical protein